MTNDLQTLNVLKAKFRCLKGWKIEYDPDAIYKGQCSFNVETKKAVVYSKNGIKVSDKKYLLHEILHIAFASAETSRELQELFIRDLCKHFVLRKQGGMVGNSILVFCGKCNNEFNAKFHPRSKYKCPKCGELNG